MGSFVFVTSVLLLFLVTESSAACTPKAGKCQFLKFRTQARDVSGKSRNISFFGSKCTHFPPQFPFFLGCSGNLWQDFFFFFSCLRTTKIQGFNLFMQEWSVGETWKCQPSENFLKFRLLGPISKFSKKSSVTRVKSYSKSDFLLQVAHYKTIE